MGRKEGSIRSGVVRRKGTRRELKKGEKRLKELEERRDERGVEEL